MSFKEVQFVQPTIGMDLEFFFKSKEKGNVIGSEIVFGKERKFNVDVRTGGRNSTFICDGVQAEINPVPSYCREQLAREIKHCFEQLTKYLATKPDVDVDFTEVVEVDKEHFDTLSDESKQFGCMPSYNSYTKDTSKISVDPKKDLTRSAGGHIHLGAHNVTVKIEESIEEKCKKCPCNDPTSDEYEEGCAERMNKSVEIKDYLNSKGYNLHEVNDTEKLMKFLKDKKVIDTTVYEKVTITMDDYTKALTEPLKLIPLMDLIVGIPSVLLDRDPAAPKRRKVYGRAGECRLQPHGIEYRTLSNFWIRDYRLMSLFTGLARTAQLIVASSYDHPDNLTGMWEGIDPLEVEKAINDSDFNLAKKIWNIVEPRLCELCDHNTGNYPITNATKDGFKYVVVHGIDKLFPKEKTISSWSNISSGWESWASSRSTVTSNRKYETMQE